MISEDKQQRPPAPFGAPGSIGGHRQINNSLRRREKEKKKTIQKVICDLWDQCCTASVTSEYHMSVSNGKRYAVEPACRVIKAGGLCVCAVSLALPR